MTSAMRVRRLFLLAFFAYVVLDLGCPHVPGAFTFDPADSVEAVSAHRMRPPAFPRVTLTPVIATPTPEPRHVATALTMPSPVRWCPRADRDHVVASDPRPSTEDH